MKPRRLHLYSFRLGHLSDLSDFFLLRQSINENCPNLVVHLGEQFLVLRPENGVSAHRVSPEEPATPLGFIAGKDAVLEVEPVRSHPVELEEAPSFLLRDLEIEYEDCTNLFGNRAIGQNAS